ncbi:MAG: hypothetical protein U9P80_02165 [Thermodesulfobacteriota bacterium]|nr:hypothetical protein [Thermodesulfobacteriota bacterium]
MDGNYMDKDKLISDLEEAINFVFDKNAPDMEQGLRKNLVSRFSTEVLQGLDQDTLEERFITPEGAKPLENVVSMFRDFLADIKTRMED